METNGGNSGMIDAFKSADLNNPLSNSLVYSVYQKMPNHTDLTVFKEKTTIDAIILPFIDDHFDYHTSLDRRATGF